MVESKHTLLLGAHVSIAGGLEKAIHRGESIGCTAIQIFTKSNRQWASSPITDDAADEFKSTLKNSIIESVVVHASYLINIASADNATRAKSSAALLDELKRCHVLGIPTLVLHPGSGGTAPAADSLASITQTLDEVFDRAPGNTKIALEIMAGQGSSMCRTFEEIAQIFDLSSHKKRLGVCFDTCHAFAAGYDFRTPITYEKMWNLFDKTIGLNRLTVIHINDSKKDLGSRVDRHEELGHGKLGTEPFKLLVNDKRFFDVPKILETPQDDLTHYLKNMQLLEKLISPKNRTSLIIKVADGVSTDRQEW